MPPGGEAEFGESKHHGVKCELSEETTFKITVGELCHINEFINPPFHAVECYFEVSRAAGNSALGYDLEQGRNQQLLEELQWFSVNDIPRNNFAPKSLLP